MSKPARSRLSRAKLSRSKLAKPKLVRSKPVKLPVSSSLRPKFPPKQESMFRETLELLNHCRIPYVVSGAFALQVQDRKSTRLNSSHRTISYAVFCLKKKKKKKNDNNSDMSMMMIQ